MKKMLAAFMLTAVLALSACGGQDAGPSDQKDTGEKALTFGSVGYFYNTGWDPAADWEGWAIGSYGVGETLFRLDDAYAAVPWLAESAEQKGKTVWEIKIREGVKFHNGKDLTADAVKKCFERTMGESKRWAEVLPIASLEAEGMTLTINLDRPASNLKNDLCDPLWLVYDAEGSEDFKKETFYTGPYIPVDFSPNKELTVKKNEGYWGEAPKLDRAVFKTVADVDTLTMAFQKGEVDIVVPLPDESVPLFAESKDAVIDSRTSARAHMLRFNMKSAAVQDVNLRNAIAFCIDREGYSKTISHGTVQPSYGVFPEQLSFGGTSGLKLTVDRFDPEAAKKLLADAGYKDTDKDGVLEKDGKPAELKMIAMSSQTGQVQMCEVLQSQLAQAGIKINLEVLEKINDARAGGQFDISCESYSMAATGNPQSFISQMFTTDGSSNFGRYSSKETDELAAQLAALEDEGMQGELVKKINQRILDDCPYIFFGHKKFTGMYNPKTVEHYRSQPSEYYILDSSTAAK